MRRPTKPAKTVRHARRLRREMSPAEVKLWCELRTRPHGLKFRRQHPAGPYSLDFYCAAARLAIEVDGEAHDRGEQPARDEARDAYFAQHGVLTMRIPAIEVFRNLEGVLLGIAEATRMRLPHHHRPAAGGPPPQAELGEDEDDG